MPSGPIMAVAIASVFLISKTMILLYFVPILFSNTLHQQGNLIVQNFDKTFTLFKNGVEESGVHFVRGIPFNIEQSSSSEKLKLRIENMNGEDTIVEHDMVVLSVGMGPAIESEKLAGLFSLNRDDFGFFSSSSPQVFVSGTCQEPLSIPDSMAAARAIAVEMQG